MGGCESAAGGEDARGVSAFVYLAYSSIESNSTAQQCIGKNKAGKAKQISRIERASAIVLSVG